MGSVEADVEIQFGVQDVYQSSTPMKEGGGSRFGQKKSKCDGLLKSAKALVNLLRTLSYRSTVRMSLTESNRLGIYIPTSRSH